MALNPRIALLCALCIVISGFLGSYKGFQLNQDQILNQQVEQSESVSHYVGQNIEQKLEQLESSVSYLDKSTIETLKRFGTRYFAYAYQKNGEWAFKWKVLGSLDKQGILDEIVPLKYSNYKLDKRHWEKSKSGELIYISPVKLAKSHQLKDGFLVFGMASDFFSSLESSDDKYILADNSRNSIFGKLPVGVGSELFVQDSEGSFLSEILENGETQITTAVFSTVSQLWIVREEVMASTPFMASHFFTYFILTSLFALVVMMILTGRKSASVIGGIAKPSLSLFGQLRLPQFNFKSLTKPVEASEPVLAEMTMENIKDFGLFLEDALMEDVDRLKNVGISIKTQFEEDADVICSPQHVLDFIKRLIGNSVSSLESAEEKEIQIQLVETGVSYQLIYVDTREKETFPSRQESSLMAQTEGSLEGIDGIISYARWTFGEGLTVAKNGFCLSVDLAKFETQSVAPVQQAPIEPEIELPANAFENLDRIEINDSDTDMDLIDGFATIEPGKMNTEETEIEEEPSVSFDKVIEQFQMKDFSFSDEAKTPVEEIKLDEEIVEEPEAEVTTDEKGFFEFESGDFKIKIRSPRKRGEDVNR